MSGISVATLRRYFNNHPEQHPLLPRDSCTFTPWRGRYLGNVAVRVSITAASILEADATGSRAQ